MRKAVERSLSAPSNTGSSAPPPPVSKLEEVPGTGSQIDSSEPTWKSPTILRRLRVTGELESLLIRETDLAESELVAALEPFVRLTQDGGLVLEERFGQ